MNNFTSVTGVITVRACPETTRVLEDLRVLVAPLDEKNIRCRALPERGPNILRIDLEAAGYASPAHVQEIDDKIRELGPYAVEAAEITGSHGCFFVGTEEQVVQAESQDALERIHHLASRLEENDAAAALDAVTRWSKMPAFKRAYFATSGNACPFCEGTDIRAGALETDGMIGWTEVECAACGHAWQDVWAMIDMTEVRDADGHEVASRRTAG